MPMPRAASRPPVSFEEERIEIPGTHVPAWVVALIVVGVLGAVTGLAFLFLR